MVRSNIQGDAALAGLLTRVAPTHWWGSGRQYGSTSANERAGWLEEEGQGGCTAEFENNTLRNLREWEGAVGESGVGGVDGVDRSE